MLVHLQKMEMTLEEQAKPGEQSKTQERNMNTLHGLHLEAPKLLNLDTRLTLDHLHMSGS